MLTVTGIVTLVVGLAYTGLFVLMAIGASAEITTFEKVLERKRRGRSQITNTEEDLLASIAENELAVIVFSTGAALTLPLVVASIVGFAGRGWARVLATLCMLPPIGVIIFGVIHDIADGHPENAIALVLTVPAIVLAVLWWLPATSRAMAARRWKRAPAHP